VAADNVRQFDRLAFGTVVPCIEVFDGAWKILISDMLDCTLQVSLRTETVTPKAKVVGIYARSVVPKVKCRFTRVRSSGVAIRYKHLRQRETVEQTPTIVMNVVQR
jgi:hypothetical protein